MSLFQNLNEEQQMTVIQLGSRAVLDPWFASLATIPIAWNLIYLPHWIKLAVVFPLVTIRYNNISPRYTNWDEVIKIQSISDFIKRCISCHENAWEAFIAFTPAVLMCRMQKVDGKVVKELCMRFMKIRLLYTFLYLIGQWRVVSGLRTLTWAAGMETIAQLYMKALMA
jgi:uncharacterized MAPEG superfamily protein